MRRLLANVFVAVSVFGGGAACDGMIVGDDPEDPDDPARARAPGEDEAALVITEPYRWDSLPGQNPLLWRCAARGRACADRPCCEGSVCLHLPGPAGTTRGSVCVETRGWREWFGWNWRD